MESRKHSPRDKKSGVNEKLDKLADEIKKLPSKRKDLIEKMMKKRLYDTAEACEILGVSQPSIRRAIQQGRIKAVHVGRYLRIPAEEIDRLVQGEEGLLNTNEAAKLLNVSPGTIRALINADKIQAFRLADAGPFKMLKSEIERIAKEGISD